MSWKDGPYDGRMTSGSTGDPGTRTIEVFADIWCPFTHVGLHAIASARTAAGRDDVGIRVRAWPLELVNGHPMDPEAAARNAAALRDQVAPDLFAHVDVAHFPSSTLEALALTEAAYGIGVAEGERTAFALRDALFERGLDISAGPVLAAIAAGVGVPMPVESDRAAVLAAWEEGRSRGVIGSPHFFCGGRHVFCPSLELTRDDRGLTAARDDAALASFVADCLAG